MNDFWKVQRYFRKPTFSPQGVSLFFLPDLSTSSYSFNRFVLVHSLTLLLSIFPAINYFILTPSLFVSFTFTLDKDFHILKLFFKFSSQSMIIILVIRVYHTTLQNLNTLSFQKNSSPYYQSHGKNPPFFYDYSGCLVTLLPQGDCV